MTPKEIEHIRATVASVSGAAMNLIEDRCKEFLEPGYVPIAVQMVCSAMYADMQCVTVLHGLWTSQDALMQVDELKAKLEHMLKHV